MTAFILADNGGPDDDKGMKAAGIREIGGQVQALELADPPNLKPDELVIEVRAASAANWDEIVRTGGWDVGIKPPMALGVSASGVVRAIGEGVRRFHVGDDVLTHPVPLRHQGAWAQQLVAAENTVARKPTLMSWQEAGVFSVPALTASQVLTTTVDVRPGEWILIHGAGGITGGMLVAVASGLGARVIATASPDNAGRVKSYGAAVVLDYHAHNWQQDVRRIAGEDGVRVAVNAVGGAAPTLMALVANGGKLTTITSDGPATERGVAVVNFYVSADGQALERLAVDFVDRHLTLPIAAVRTLSEAGAALQMAVAGKAAGAVVIDPRQ
ncbi:MAG TPA: NADP-dependent oxidoreductase [Candidatus Dormibacteraeota bacterium]